MKKIINAKPALKIGDVVEDNGKYVKILELEDIDNLSKDYRLCEHKYSSFEVFMLNNGINMEYCMEEEKQRKVFLNVSVYDLIGLNNNIVEEIIASNK